MNRVAIVIAVIVVATAGYGAMMILSDPSSPPITLLAKQSVAATKTLSDKVIPDTDLPPPGTRSLFDHIVAQNDVLPYPFEKLIALLREQNPAGLNPVTLLIPNGRSLLKGQADNANPRVVVATDYDGSNTPVGLGKATRGQLFLGFVENAKEIEVVSYNEAAGRFEYQLVQNYCSGCVPRIVYARRAICLTCHQGTTPIFSQRPWNETNGQEATAAAILAARGDNKPYHGVAIAQPLSSSERFDQLTDIGNFYHVSQRLWLDGCGENGRECRRQMLILALQYSDSPGGFDANASDANRLRELQRMNFPSSGIAVPESDLQNRDPIAEKQGFKGWLRSLVTRDFNLGEGAKDNEDLSAFEKLPPLRTELDPLNIRAAKQVLNSNDIDGVYGLARVFTEADLKTLGEHHSNSLVKLLAKVRALPVEVFAAKPFSRVAMMQALTGKPLEYCCIKTDEMSPPVASGVPPLAIKAHPELQPFAEYCFACHRGNPAKRLNFMAGDTELAVLDNIKKKTEIRDALDWERYAATDKATKLMPPRDSAQYHALSKAGAEADKTRAQMRALVPGMFSF